MWTRVFFPRLRMTVLGFALAGLASCGSLGHLTPPGFGGGRPDDVDPDIAPLIEAEKASATRTFLPLASVPDAPADMPTADWADALERDLGEGGDEAPPPR